ncbi:MAG: nucleotide exchange factor GrpE [Deltaproteobacteria bacterium]|nr:nucleotide exchange factor GrpE [Deltaproteobacteria bacterium]
MSTSEHGNGQAPVQEQSDSSVSQETTAEHQQAESAVDELTALRLQVEEKTKEAKANYDLFLRERAENENFKRRLQREKSEAIRFANEPLVREILPVLDNLERAIAHTQSGGGGQSLVDGVTLVARSFLETLEKHGVSRVSAKGQSFDPTKHEAMAQVESAEVAPNTVVDEYTPAYMLHDRLLRPALVTVSKAPSE